MRQREVSQTGVLVCVKPKHYSIQDMFVACYEHGGKSNWRIDMRIAEGLLYTGRGHGLLSTGGVNQTCLHICV